MNSIPFWIPTFFTGLAMTLPIVITIAFLKFCKDREKPDRTDWLQGSLLLISLGGWLGLSGVAAYSGWLLDFSGKPPNLFRLLALQTTLCLILVYSRWGTRLAWGTPLALQIGIQGFRFPLELVMHRAADIGLMPPQMSYSGYNFDILTGVSAIVIARYLANDKELPRWILLAWNSLGLFLLCVVVTVALLSAPTPMRYFHNEPANTWIAYLPYVWLPTIMVATAFVGHLLIYRRLLGVQPEAPRL